MLAYNLLPHKYCFFAFKDGLSYVSLWFIQKNTCVFRMMCFSFRKIVYLYSNEPLIDHVSVFFMFYLFCFSCIMSFVTLFLYWCFLSFWNHCCYWQSHNKLMPWSVDCLESNLTEQGECKKQQLLFHVFILFS